MSSNKFKVYKIEPTNAQGEYVTVETIVEKMFALDAAFKAKYKNDVNAAGLALIKFNNEIPESERPKGWQRIKPVNKCDDARIYDGQNLAYPPITGDVRDVRKVKGDCGPLPCPPEKPVPAVVQPVVEAPARVLVPHEYGRVAVPPTDGTDWVVGSQLHALERLARSGLAGQYRGEDGKLRSRFSESYYALTSVAGRTPVIGASQSGLIGRKVEGNVTSDHRLAGDRSFEDSESSVDDGVASRDGVSGPSGMDGRFIGGPRERVGGPGHIETIKEDGTMVRNADIKKWEFAHGGNYRISLLGGIGLPVGDLFDLPVGGVGSSPRSQYLSPAEMQRYGISQAYTMTSTNKVGGFDNMFSDEQALNSSPQEVANRINNFADALYTRAEMAKGMREFDAATDPVAKRAAARHALVALRDYADNKQVKRVDAMRIPLTELGIGLSNYFESQGIRLAKEDLDYIANAPLLELVDMPQEMLETMQDYERYKDSRYEGIKPGQTNPAYTVVTKNIVHGAMNANELKLAKGYGRVRPEAELAGDVRDALGIVAAKDESIRVLAQAMTENQSLALHFGQLLADMPRNPEAYGFKSRSEAIDYLKQRFINGNKQVEEELLSRGDTSILNSLLPISSDDRYSMQRPWVFGAAAGPMIAQNPDLFRDAMNRASNMELGHDKDGKFDGRPFALAVLQSLGSQSPAPGAKNGAEHGPMEKALLAAVDADKKKFVEDTIYDVFFNAESAVSGYDRSKAQELDNRYVAAQLGAQAAAGKNVGVAADGQSGNAKTVFNTGAVDAKAAFEAGKSGDKDAIYKAVLDGGASQVAVMGLTAHPALSRDAVLMTLLKNPDVFNKAIAKLDSLSDSISIERYGKLAGRLEVARREIKQYLAGEDEDGLEQAVKSFGDFFLNTADVADSNAAALRVNAWNAFVTEIGKDPAMSAALINTIATDKPLRNAMLKAIPDSLMTTDGVNYTASGRMGQGSQLPQGFEGNDVYWNRIFNFKKDDKGRVESDGWFTRLGFNYTDNIEVNRGELDKMLAGTAEETSAPSVAVDPKAVGAAAAAAPLVNKGVTAADVLNAAPVTIKLDGGVSTAKSLAAHFMANAKARGVAMTEAEAAKMAEGAINNGLYSVGGTPEALLAIPNSTAINAALANGSDISRAWGIDKRILLLLLIDTSGVPSVGGDGYTFTPQPGCPPIPGVPCVPGGL